MTIVPAIQDSHDLNFTAAQVVPLGIFCFFMTFFGIFGNGTVIYASIRYNAIRLDKVSLIFVQNLALADMLYTICVILPQFVTYTAGSWILGDVYCFVMAQVGIIPVSANTCTVLAITAYRLRVVTNPFLNVSKKYARIAVGITWIIACIPTVVFQVYKAKSAFHPENGRCLSDIYDNDSARVLVMSCVGLIVVLPLFAITTCNIILCTIAAKHSRRSPATPGEKGNYRALLMVCCLSGLFIISWTPYLVYTFLKIKRPNMPAALDLLAFHCIFINSFGNPILYTVTNKRFGLFVRQLVLNLLCLAKGIDVRDDTTGDSGSTSKRSNQVPILDMTPRD